LQSRIEDIRAEDAEVLAISTDTIEDTAAAFASKGFTFPILADPERVAVDAYGVRHALGGIRGDDIARPAVFVIDREGRIVWRDLTENWRVRVRPERILDQLRAIP
jgi:peroxiredoxin Q/BCP